MLAFCFMFFNLHFDSGESTERKSFWGFLIESAKQWMTPSSVWHNYSLTDLGKGGTYNLGISAIIPRPVAVITTINPLGLWTAHHFLTQAYFRMIHQWLHMVFVYNMARKKIQLWTLRQTRSGFSMYYLIPTWKKQMLIIWSIIRGIFLMIKEVNKFINIW